MNTSGSKQNKLVTTVMAFAIGAVAFVVVNGYRALDPGNIAWLDLFDPSTHYLGWLFFRDTPWSFPIGLNPDYGIELSNSILFSDSNPLLAFLFKPLSPWLPEPFQYFGLWLLACFVLQAWFGWKLVEFISSSPLICALGAGLFAVAPPMIWRIPNHLSLAGHFVIVAGIYFALKSDLQRRSLAWGALLIVTALVQPYILVMVLALWLADLTARVIRKKLTVVSSIGELLGLILLLAITCWQTGYFSVDGGPSGAGFGRYSMNALSIVNPSGWSYVLPDLPKMNGQFEGFNYFGLGGLILVVFALPVLISGRADLIKTIARYPILLLAMVALLLFALSNNITIGPYIFKYPLPDKVVELANIFRSSGRMFWPVFYAILLAAIFLVVRGYKQRTAALMLGLALVIQVVDTSAGYKANRKKMMIEPAAVWNTPFVAPFFDAAASQYSKVRWIMPGVQLPQWRPVAAYAGKHGLATDSVYLARVSPIALKKAQDESLEAIQTGKYAADSLYFIDDRFFREAAINANRATDLLVRLNGFNILAPGWKTCAACPDVDDELAMADLIPPLASGARIGFDDSGNGPTYLARGWGYLQPSGVWPENNNAVIVLSLSSADAPVFFLIEASPLPGPADTKQRIEVSVNGVLVAKTELTANMREFEVAVPKAIVEKIGANVPFKLEFYFPDGYRPVDVAESTDNRFHAINLQALTVRW